MSIIGYRCWVARACGEQPCLQSLYTETAWPHDRPLEAACPREHRPVRRDCECGIYAWLTPGHAPDLAGKLKQPIPGKVQLWGWTMRLGRAGGSPDTVVATHARVLALYAFRPHLERLADAYHVPLLDASEWWGKANGPSRPRADRGPDLRA